MYDPPQSQFDGRLRSTYPPSVAPVPSLDVRSRRRHGERGIARVGTSWDGESSFDCGSHTMGSTDAPSAGENFGSFTGNTHLKTQVLGGDSVTVSGDTHCNPPNGDHLVRCPHFDGQTLADCPGFVQLLHPPQTCHHCIPLNCGSVVGALKRTVATSKPSNMD